MIPVVSPDPSCGDKSLSITEQTIKREGGAKKASPSFFHRSETRVNSHFDVLVPAGYAKIALTTIRRHA